MKVTSIQKTFYKVGDFISWQKAGNLELSPFFQRRSVWKLGAKSFLIDTIVRGLPIPIVFLRDQRIDPKKYEPVREVVDGQQRLRTVISFVAPELLQDFDPKRDAFIVKKTHNKEMAGKAFTELDDETKRAILEYEFDVHIFPSRVDDREIIQIFRRMNSTNFNLNTQERRNAEYFGEFKTSVYGLAGEQLNRWRKWKTFNEDDIARMSEVEHTAECFLLIINGQVSGKSAPRIDKAFSEFDEIFPHKDRLERRFRKVMDTIDLHFSKELPEFAFFKKTLLYTFFGLVYSLIYSNQSVGKPVKSAALNNKQVSTIKLLAERISRRTAPENVLEASDRRTTNPKERGILYKYLLQNVKNAK